MKNLHVVTSLRTNFQVQSEIESAMAETVRNAYERGQKSGEWLARRSADKMLGLGWLFGLAFGVMCTLVAQGWFSP